MTAELDLGVFHDGQLVAEVPASNARSAYARSEFERDDAYRMLAEIGQGRRGYEVLRRCPTHRDASIVDCAICDPSEED